MNVLRLCLLITLVLLVRLSASCCAQEVTKQQSPITALAIPSDAASVITGSQAGIEIRAWRDLKPLEKLATELSSVHDIQFSPNGKHVLLAGGDPGESGSLELWTWPEKKLVGRAKLHTDVIYKASWSPNGEQIITAGADGIAKIIDPKTLAPRTTYEHHSRAVLAAIWLPKADQALTASVDQTIQLWNVADANRIHSLSNHVAEVNDLALRPTRADSQPILVSISEDRSVRLWWPTAPRLLRFTKLPSPPRSVKWDRKGDQLFVGCNDGQIRVLDFNSLATKRQLPGEVGRVHELILHPREDLLLVAGERGVNAIDLSSKK